MLLLYLQRTAVNAKNSKFNELMRCQLIANNIDPKLLQWESKQPDFKKIYITQRLKIVQ